MRKLIFSKGSEKRFRKFLERHQNLKTRVKWVFSKLSQDPLDREVGTHKLTGKLAGQYGADINFRYRIVFSFDKENIYLINVGTHDEVY